MPDVISFRSVRHRPVTALLSLLLGLGLLVPLASAQNDVSDDLDMDTSNPRSAVRISGSGTEGAPAEAESGLGTIYGGVSGSAGVYGEKVGGPKKKVPTFHLVRKGDTL
jgi:hypothetical protein